MNRIEDIEYIKCNVSESICKLINQRYNLRTIISSELVWKRLHLENIGISQLKSLGSLKELHVNHYHKDEFCMSAPQDNSNVSGNFE